jgi:hypothetical protein
LVLLFGEVGLLGNWYGDVVAAVAGFFVAFGFFGSRLPRFCPLAIAVHSRVFVD